MSLKDKLNRYKTHMALEEAKPQPLPSATVPFLQKWADLEAKPYMFEDDYVMIRDVRYPLSTKHGRYTFGELPEIVDKWEQSGLQHPLSTAAKSPHDLLFFDTETTGLSGGVGNTIFLLGCSRLEEDSVSVRQYFLAEPSAEAALYHSFLADIESMNDLVTFNGKAFDWPQVKTRHTLLRDVVPELPAFGHYDLLHGSRRLWKHELESCRLTNIEQEKLGLFRQDDVPGYMAPILYFEYLETKDPDVVQGVLQHNETDVLSLITLYIHISRLLLEHAKAELTVEERFQIAKWYDALGEHKAALANYQTVAASQHALRTKAKLAVGLHYKRQKNWQLALGIWEEALQGLNYEPEELHIEIAKVYEHQIRDYEKALYYTNQAFEAWKKRKNLLRQKAPAEQAAYHKRIERLTKRIGHLV